ncbi:hypothetical protein BaRGS_00005343 [Batillaria attramentaria]|uniref:Uncharacterized protein n=1 Tax=Batillaria attramentaria TaxID=370345 RepID=A0ABD0LVM8_9CAEN
MQYQRQPAFKLSTTTLLEVNVQLCDDTCTSEEVLRMWMSMLDVTDIASSQCVRRTILPPVCSMVGYQQLFYIAMTRTTHQPLE